MVVVWEEDVDDAGRRDTCRGGLLHGVVVFPCPSGVEEGGRGGTLVEGEREATAVPCAAQESERGGGGGGKGRDAEAVLPSVTRTVVVVAAGAIIVWSTSSSSSSSVSSPGECRAVRWVKKAFVEYKENAEDGKDDDDEDDRGGESGEDEDAEEEENREGVVVDESEVEEKGKGKAGKG